MKKFVYCEGVYEAWMLASDDDEYADEKTPYFESGPYYLASDVDALIAEHQSLEGMQDIRIKQLEKALRELDDLCTNASRNHMDIDPEVHVIVRKALGL